MRVALINAPLKSAVCDFGVGHQMPLGLLMIGGAIRDLCEPVLIDAAREHMSETAIVAAVKAFEPDLVFIAHVGSTQAHPCCMATMSALKAALPDLITVYGGVHPTYHAREILEQGQYVDFIVRGEGEETARALLVALRAHADLAQVDGLAWKRSGGEVVLNASRTAIADLDAYPIAWDLITDWDRYRAFGFGRAAVVQFSRGCPHTCTYCGQWMFWKSWRRRDIVRFVDEIALLRNERDVRFLWLADENPTTLKHVWRDLLEEIARRNLGLAICASIRARDIVRDQDILPLYRDAGFVYVLMGVETVTDETLAKIRKDSVVDDAHQAVRLLREHDILSIVDYIFGLEDESVATIRRGLRGLLKYDGDFVNALYVTPHSWTALGRSMRDAKIVEPDLWKWDYRHQVVGVSRLSPTQLFLGVKLLELLYHLRPKRLLRLVSARSPRVRRLLRHSAVHVAMVYAYELCEYALEALRRRRKSVAERRSVRRVRSTPEPTLAR